MKKIISLMTAVAAAGALIITAGAKDIDGGIVRVYDRDFVLEPGVALIGDNPNTTNTAWDAVLIPGFELSDGNANKNKLSQNYDLWNNVKSITGKFYIDVTDPAYKNTAQNITMIQEYVQFGEGTNWAFETNGKNIVKSYGDKKVVTVTWPIAEAMKKALANAKSTDKTGVLKLGLQIKNEGKKPLPLKIVWTELKVNASNSKKVQEYSDIAVKMPAVKSYAAGDSFNYKSTLAVKNAKVTYSSSNETIAKVDKNGKVTAVSPGNVTIAAKTGSGKTEKTDSVNFNVVKKS
jgi:hypothetical protein